MDEALALRIERSLTTKREALRTWADRAAPEELQEVLGPTGREPFERHMEVLDTAIAEVEDRTLGTCTTCHEPVESALIQMDYTCCVCLEHLSDEERRNLENELAMAGAVQRSLLPQQPPSFPRLEISAFSRPAQIVSGDYFDFFPFAGGRQGVAISDVAGHGMSASLIMASLQTMLRTLAQDYDSPAELTGRINRLCLHNIQFTTFITFFVGAFDPDRGQLTYCNAGHNPPLLVRGDGTTAWLGSTGAALGLAEDSPYVDASVTLAVGDVLLLYTDGLTETVDTRGRLFGAERLARLTREQAGLPAQRIIQAVLRELDAYGGGVQPADDRTIVVMRVVA